MPAVATAPSRAVTTRPRLDSLDLLRGLVMVIMAIDHTRDLFMAQTFDPVDLTKTWPALFFTRWITHFCAPIFVFLAGAGAYLYGKRGRSTAELSRFLVTRGLWLIVLEFTLVGWGWMFNLQFQFLVGQVIWAIGVSMIVLSMLIRLPIRVIAGIGIGILVLHNATDPIRARDLGAMGWIWGLFHEVTIRPVRGHTFLMAYPLLPWIGVMCAGYSFGSLFGLERERRSQILRKLGAAMIAAFVIIRASNLYGDPGKWSVQKSVVYTVMSFLNCQKYPPSLLYLLMTLGPAILLLGYLPDNVTGKLGKPLVVFGRVPLFYYLLHVPLLHAMALVYAYSRFGGANWLFTHPALAGQEPGAIPPDYSLPLWGVYAMWLVAVMALYPLCVWFAEVKRRSRSPWLSYL